MKVKPISQTPWKKQRIPRKLKKQLKKEGKLEFVKRLCKIANYGREFAYQVRRDFYPIKCKIID